MTTKANLGCELSCTVKEKALFLRGDSWYQIRGLIPARDLECGVTGPQGEDGRNDRNPGNGCVMGFGVCFYWFHSNCMTGCVVFWSNMATLPNKTVSVPYQILIDRWKNENEKEMLSKHHFLKKKSVRKEDWGVIEFSRGAGGWGEGSHKQL